MCTASRKTSPNSATFTMNISLQHEQPVQTLRRGQGQCQHVEMHRQEQRQHKAGNAMQDECVPERMAAMRAYHDTVTAITARKPNPNRPAATAQVITLKQRAFQAKRFMHDRPASRWLRERKPQ